MDLVLDIKDLVVHYETEDSDVHAVNGIDIAIGKQRTLGLVGETGAGKTTTALSIMNLVPDPPGVIKSGSITLEGRDVLKMSNAELEAMRGNDVAMIFQDPMACLNPRRKVKDIIAQGLIIHHQYKDQADLDEKVYRILEKVGLSREQATRFPSQFSGGQRQRVGIARALIMNPRLVIADECISALDVSIQAQVVNLMKDLQDELGTTYLFIAHDLSMVKYISDRIGIMHLGHIVETGTTDEIFENAIHPYTKSLLSAIPHPNPIVEKKRVALVYDKEKEGVDYTKGVEHKLSDTHFVLATDEEFAKWNK